METDIESSSFSTLRAAYQRARSPEHALIILKRHLIAVLIVTTRIVTIKDRVVVTKRATPYRPTTLGPTRYWI